VADEAARIHLNVADANVLAALPGMTDERVDCLLDYRDDDHDPRPAGAEQDHYLALPQPYLIPNGPLATVEELLLVKGFDGAVVYGDAHGLKARLGVDRESRPGFADDRWRFAEAGGEYDPGLVGLLTVYSYELDVDGAGQPRIDINGPNEQLDRLPGAGLPDGTVEFIRQVRADGNTFAHPTELLAMRYKLTEPSPRDRRRGRWRRRRANRQRAERWIESGVGREQLATVCDKLTVGSGGKAARVKGLVNVNTAPAAVLAALPGVDEELARRIVDARGRIAEDGKRTVAWLYAENLVDVARFKEIAPRLTARSYQFRVRSVGFGVPRGRFCVLEAVIDLAARPPAVLYVRELTRLGRPAGLALPSEDG
jgi:hypothetical protein